MRSSGTTVLATVNYGAGNGEYEGGREGGFQPSNKDIFLSR